jgi:AraC-like DNA-binding protein
MSAAAMEDRMLAQAAGCYRERAIEGPLQDHFTCVWVHQMPGADVAPVVVVPDGCIDLEWIDGALRIAGPDRAPKIERLAAGATVVGFRFRPAAAAAWLGLPACETVDRRIPLEAFWGADARRVAAQASEARDIGARVRSIESALARRAPSIPARPPDMHAAFELLATGAPPGKALIPWLAEELALSERTLRRRFDAAFGYGPKTLDRILRFQRFLKLLRGARNGSTAGLAMEAGYADQAHLGRESRRLAVTTPQRIAALLAGRPAQ